MTITTPDTTSGTIVETDLHGADPWAEPAPVVRTPAVEVYSRVMVTGHRPQHFTPDQIAWVQVSLHHTAWRLRSVYGAQHGISGLALGADTWWALAVLASGMHLHSFIPFEDQPTKWQAEDRAMWAELRRKSTTERIIGGKSYDVKMLHARNDAMLKSTQEGSGLVVAVWNGGDTGGTASAVKKARKMGLPLLILDPTTKTIRREGW